MISNIKRGETTLDVLKRRSGPRPPSAPVPVLSLLASSKLTKESYLWIPREVFSSAELARLPSEYQGCPFVGVPVSLEPGDRIYDLGKDRNWKRWLALRDRGLPGVGVAMQGSDELSMCVLVPIAIAITIRQLATHTGADDLEMDMDI